MAIFTSVVARSCTVSLGAFAGLGRGAAWRAAGLAALALTLAVLPAAAWAYAPAKQVDLRVLLLSADGSEPTFAAWSAALSREGVPFDAVIADQTAPITADSLQHSGTHGRYQAVVLATGGLLQCTVFTCTSALDIDEWLALNAYQQSFGVRRVTAYAYPTPEYGLNYPFGAADISNTEGHLTAAGEAEFGYLRGPVPIDVGTWGYYATPVTPAAGAASPFTTLVAGPVDSAGTPSALVGVYARPDGFEELVMTYAANPTQLQSLVLGHGLVGWVTQGVRLGFHRNYYTLHVDDIFVADDRWDVIDNVTYEDDGATNPLIRMVPSDVERALAWQAATGLQLDMVFNGAGSADAIAANGTDPLTTSLLAHRKEFNWINHTWSHLNLDAVTAEEIEAEIRKNLKWAKAHKIQVDGRELVTGEHSGLDNPAMAVALSKTKMRWVAADNSKQPNPYAIGTAMTIPRHPSNLYYNVGTFEEQLDEYNYIYYDNCTNTATTTCFWQPATWATYVDNEARIMLQHLLGNDPRPHYIHQCNLAEDGTMYPVVNEMLARYQRYVTAPIEQPTFTAIGELMARFDAWLDASGGYTPGLTAAYHQDGVIYLAGAASLEVPVTGTVLGERYGGERSGWIKLRRGRTVSLAIDNGR